MRPFSVLFYVNEGIHDLSGRHDGVFYELSI